MASLWLIILIGYDRYNVIVKGLSGKKITPGIAFLMIVYAFGYATAVCILPMLEVWGRYTLGKSISPYITFMSYHLCLYMTLTHV